MKAYVNYTSTKQNKKHPQITKCCSKTTKLAHLLTCRSSKKQNYYLLETILLKTNLWSRVTCTLMYNDTVVYKRADRAINKGIVFPFSPVIASLALIIQFLVFTVWHLYCVLHSNSTYKGLYGKAFLPTGNCHQNNPL